MTRFSLLLTSVILVSVATASAQAQQPDIEIRGKLATISVDIKAPARAKTPTLNGNFYYPVEVHKGHPEAFVHGGSRNADRHARFLELADGNEYTISVDFTRYAERTKTNDRYRVGIAVDGRCVMTGDKIPVTFNRTDSWKKCMIVRDAYKWLGWRGSSKKVRAFVATDAEKSLAAQWKDTSATGTIVIAIFRSKDAAPYKPEFRTKGIGGGTSKGVGGTRGLGTTAGREIRSEVTSTTFDPMPEAFETFVIRYGTEQELKSWGVIKKKEKPSPANRLFNNDSFIQFPDEKK